MSNGIFDTVMNVPIPKKQCAPRTRISETVKLKEF
jgi:hypothetical protein